MPSPFSFQRRWLRLPVVVLVLVLVLAPSVHCLTSPWSPPSSAKILRQDPLVYTIPQLLSPQECHEYQDYVMQWQSKGRPMTRSNPPKVSVDRSKLWPLPFFSLAAGIPSVVKTMDLDSSIGISVISGSSVSPTMLQILQAAFLPIAIAWILIILMVAAAPPLVQIISNPSVRTSVAMALNQEEDISFVTPLVDRIVTVTGHEWNRWEAPVLTRYDAGAIFAKHGDASLTRGSEWQDEGGQRVITCICYLNNCPGGGGETYFDRLNLAVVPEVGKALIFFPADYESLQADDRTTHESLPPLEDEKWIVQMFGRVGSRVPSPLGLPDEYPIKVV